MKKIFALVLAMLLVLGMTSALANDITVSGAVEGETYTIYKMLDLAVNNETTPTAYTYTINDAWEDFWTTGAGAAYIDTNTVGSNTYVIWKSDKTGASDLETFGKAAAAYAAENNIAPAKDAVEATASGASFTGLDDGYYLVTSTLGIAVSFASTPANPAQTISEKNSTSTSDKDVKEDSTGNYGKANDAQVGDTIEFKATVNIAKNSINVVYHDKMDSQLDWTGVDEVTVYTDSALTTELDDGYYTVNVGTSPETFNVVFNDNYVAGLTADTTTLYIYYTAILNDTALVTDEINNEQYITYGDSGEGTHTTTTTTTHKFILNKIDGATQDLLAGAKFQIFTQEEGGTALKLAKNAAGTIYRIYNDAEDDLPEGFTPVEDKKIVTIATSTIEVHGVDSDSYWLEETDAPVGYNALTDRQAVVVDATNNVQATVTNNQGSTLPSTGGIGTTIFYVAGGILVLAAVILLVTKRRMKAED